MNNDLAKRPNILFLMTDEHRADVTGFSGNSVVRTPVLDALAQDSVIFNNAYTPSPVCVPARQCIAAGQLPKTCGCEGWVDLAPGYMTLPRRFAENAYQTVACGKLHHLNHDQMQGWTRRIGSDTAVDPRHIENKVDTEFARYQRPYGDYAWNDTKEIKRAGVGSGPWVKHDAYAVEGALNLIEEHFCSPYYDREQIAPLFLKVSLMQPHFPYLTGAEKFNYYLNRVEPYVNEEKPDHPWLCQRYLEVGNDVTEREVRRTTAAYYGMIETADEHFGRVLRALEHAGQDLDDWIIVFTSDHGEMLGEHGVWTKVKFYEGSARVPLFIRAPKYFKGGRTVEQNVNLCDLFATLCDLAGIQPPSNLDSRSLVPLLRGEASNWDNETLSQFGEKCLMIKRDHLKYQYLYYYETEYPEVLFDLKRDPQERVNFIDDPEYSAHVAAFRERLSELGHGRNPNPNYTNAGYHTA